LTVTQDSSADAAPAAPPETSAQLENWVADESRGSRTIILKSRGPNSLPSGASRSRRTGPGDVQENGIRVGCVAQGKGGEIDTIGAEASPDSLSEMVTGALWSIGPGLNSLSVKWQSPPACRIDRRFS
jgi:hypothetical protein